jgi:multidrug efflux pump subunit AcrA (membrane-fusion protein)
LLEVLVSQTKRKVLIILVSGLILTALAAGVFHPSRKVSASPATILPTLDVVQVKQKDVPVFGESIGTLDGLVNAYVRAQVTGYLQQQGYKEGAFVRKGQLLFQIDPRPFQAILDQAGGQLLQDKAMLAIAQAVQVRTHAQTPESSYADLPLWEAFHDPKLQELAR